MSIQLNPNVSSPAIGSPISQPGVKPAGSKITDFGDALANSFRQVNQDQADANASIVDLLSGKQQDINSVVASMAKADMSFKLLVGVRNKLVEAYKETMRMQV